MDNQQTTSQTTTKTSTNQTIKTPVVRQTNSDVVVGTIETDARDGK